MAKSMVTTGVVKGKAMNPSAPGMGIPIKKSPITGTKSANPVTTSPIMKKVKPKGVLAAVTKPGLTNIATSIKPTVRSTPYSRASAQ